MFTKQMMEFLVENRIKNSREWFQSHKEQYQQYVLNPLMELVVNISPLMLSIDPLIVCEPKIDKTISRIYRDVRFSKDKSLYRDEIWVSFARDKKAFPLYPQFFVVITPQKFLYGGGYFVASTKTMNSIHSLVLNRDPMFMEVLNGLNNQDVFKLEGELYKKNYYQNEPGELQSWLNRKNLGLEHTSQELNRLFAADFSDQLLQDFKLLIPLYKFLIRAETYNTQPV